MHVIANAVRLKPSFDPGRLLADWNALASVTQHPQPGQYHTGGWLGASLIAPGGLATWTAACLPIGLRPSKTPLLKLTPAFEHILDSLSCPIESARISTLLPGERIRTHRDNLTNLRSGVVRLHIPITTHPDVEFIVNGARYVLEPGTLWYANFAKRHSVSNPTTTPRVHLLVDAIANPDVVELFPSDWLRTLASGDLFLPPPELPSSALKLPSPSRCFELAPALRSEVMALRKFAAAAVTGVQGRFAADRPADSDARVLSFERSAEGPVMHLDHEPYAALVPISETSFRMFGFLPCVTSRFVGDQVCVFYKTRLIARCPAID